MVSQVMLAQIDKRLRQATGKKTLFFGGLSVILIGDPGQLPPVSGHSLYHFPTTTTLAAHGLNCYKQFVHAICLNKCERQQNLNNDSRQEYFIQFLSRLRDGLLDDKKTYEDWQFLLQNVVTPQKLIEFADAMRLFPDNASCHEFNKKN